MRRKHKKSPAEEPSEQHSPTPVTPYVRKRSPWKRIVIALVLLVILAGLGAGGYWYHKRSPKTTTSSSTSSGVTVVKPSSTSSTGVSQYTAKGSDLDLSFNYPSSWSVTPPTTTDTNDKPITVTSPLTTIVSATGSSVTGKVVLQIRPGNASISELGSNAPIVPLPSTQVAYSQPTANQFQYPYITYIHFANGAKVSKVFEETMITGSQAFAQDETLEAGSLGGLDPIITATFYQCSTQACTGSGQSLLSITSSTWQNAPLFQQVLTMFESFKFN